MTLQSHHAGHGPASLWPSFHEREVSVSLFKGSLPWLLTLILGTRPGTEYAGRNHGHHGLDVSLPGMDVPCQACSDAVRPLGGTEKVTHSCFYTDRQGEEGGKRA